MGFQKVPLYLAHCSPFKAGSGRDRGRKEGADPNFHSTLESWLVQTQKMERRQNSISLRSHPPPQLHSSLSSHHLVVSRTFVRRFDRLPSAKEGGGGGGGESTNGRRNHRRTDRPSASERTNLYLRRRRKWN